MTYVIKGQAVKAYPLAESLSKVTITSKTPQMFKMLANYHLPAKLVVKENKAKKD
jgi:hypothetical protein